MPSRPFHYCELGSAACISWLRRALRRAAEGSGGFAWSQVAQLGANDHSHPATPAHTEPRITWSDGSSSHVCHYTATRYDRLTVKQVHRELLIDFADPGGIGGTTTGSSLPRSRNPGAPELTTPARPPRGGRPRLPSRPVPFPRWQASRYEEPGWAPGDWLAVLSAVVARPDSGEPRLGVELGGDHVLDVGRQRGVRRPGLKSERPPGPPCRARAVPCPLTTADRDHAASANPAPGAGYHALFRALVSLTQYIRSVFQHLRRGHPAVAHRSGFSARRASDRPDGRRLPRNSSLFAVEGYLRIGVCEQEHAATGVQITVGNECLCPTAEERVMAEYVHVLTTIDSDDDRGELAPRIAGAYLAARTQTIGPVRSSHRGHGKADSSRELCLPDSASSGFLGAGIRRNPGQFRRGQAPGDDLVIGSPTDPANVVEPLIRR